MPKDPNEPEPVKIKCPKCKEAVLVPKVQADTTGRARCSQGHEFEIARAI